MKKIILAAWVIIGAGHLAQAETVGDVYPDISSVPAVLIEPMRNTYLYEETYLDKILQMVRCANSTHQYAEQKDIETEIKRRELIDHMSAIAQVMQYDMDADGVVTAAEIIEGRQITFGDTGRQEEFRRLSDKMMKNYDDNKDGRITLKELANYKVNDENLPSELQYLKALLELDPNRDGKLTVEELSVLARKAFRTVDENKNGILDFDELEKIRAVPIHDVNLSPNIDTNAKGETQKQPQ